MTKSSFENIRRLTTLIFLVLVVLTTTAQTPTQQVVTSLEEVVDAINTATNEILLVTDVLRTQEVADALREALAVRGVPVYLLIPSNTVEENASYVASLAHAGANVRLLEVSGSFLVIDRHITIAGPLIGSLGQAGEGMPTVYIEDPTYAAQFIEGFVQSFETAQGYTPIGQQ